MTDQMQYVVDRAGKKRSVVIPVADWERLQQDYQKLKNKVEVLEGIKRGVLEVKRSRKSGKRLLSLGELLNGR